MCSDAEPRQRKGQFCPGRLAPSSRRSIPPRQSPFARHEPVCDRRRSDERPPGRTAGGRGWCPRFSRRSLCPIQISLSKHQRPRALRPASSPRCACGFRPGGERRQTPTMARPGRVMRRAIQCREEHHAAHHQTSRLPAPRLPQPGPARRHVRRPPDARPSQTAPEGEDAGTGFATLSGK